jgi:hypothetical protein
MTAPIGFPLATLYEITGVTQDMPGRVSVNAVTLANGFSLTNGMTFTVSNVVGMFQLNKNRYIVGNLNIGALTFDLFDLRYFAVDTSGFSSYISGGQIDIISYPPPAGQPPGLMYNNQ